MTVAGVDLGTRWLALAMVEYPWLRLQWAVTLQPKLPARENNTWARISVLCEQIKVMAPALEQADVLAVELPRTLRGDGQRLMATMGPVIDYLGRGDRPTVMVNPNKGLPIPYKAMFDYLGLQVREEHQVDAVRATILGYAAAVLRDDTMGEVYYL